MCDKAEDPRTENKYDITKEQTGDSYVVYKGINDLRGRQEYYIRKLIDIQKAIDALKCI